MALAAPDGHAALSAASVTEHLPPGHLPRELTILDISGVFGVPVVIAPS